MTRLPRRGRITARGRSYRSRRGRRCRCSRRPLRASTVTCSLIEQLVALLGDQDARNCRETVTLRGFGAAAEGLAEHVAEIDHADRPPGMAGNLEASASAAGIADLDLDLFVVQLGARAALAEASRVAARRLAPTRASSTRSSAFCWAFALDLFALAARGPARCRSRGGRGRSVDIAANIADLGELGRLDLEERRARRAWPDGGRSRSCRRRSGRS